MKLITCLSVAFALAIAVSGEQQKVLRRVIKSTPTATSLGRIRAVTVRSATAAPESGAVAEISSKEAANYGQRSANETNSSPTTSSSSSSETNKLLTSVKTRQPSTTTQAPISSTTSTTSSTTTSTTSKPELKIKASDRQQAGEVELLSSAPSSWQTMTAVEAPAAMLIATGARAQSANSVQGTSDLSQSSSNLHLTEESNNYNNDVLRSSATKGSYTRQDSSSVGEQTFSRLRQQSTKQQQQSFFYPQQAPLRASKTNNQATKTHWYQPPATTPKPAPIVQQEQQHYEQQQNEQYVEQQQEYNAAPLGQAEPFAFDFNTKDSYGNGQYRKEESDKNGVVKGSYGYTDANGIYRHVEYVADQNGFRANIKSNEPGMIGETQPASIQLASGPGSPPARLSSNNQESGDNGQWNSLNNANEATSADLALAPPDFESSHKSDRIREPRHFRN